MRLFSQILITQNFQEAIDLIEQEAKKRGFEVVSIIKDTNFLVKDVEEATKKAYTTSQTKEIIILGAENFSEIVQNKLLKILEEPPKNKEFILLFKSKSAILNTIKSRLPITTLEKVDDSQIEIPNLDSLNSKEVYEFVQKSKRLSNEQMKLVVQKIFKEAIKTQKFNFKDRDLDFFKNSIIALDYGSSAGFVLIGVLLKLLEIKRA